jgi:hypothetical protein
MRRYYRRCDAIVVPTRSSAAIMRAQRMNRTSPSGPEASIREFSPERRSLEWR